MCPHRRGFFVKMPHKSGNGFHIMERCPDCGANVRGAGVWVAHDQCPGDPYSYPACPGTGSQAQQRGLFDTPAEEKPITVVSEAAYAGWSKRAGPGQRWHRVVWAQTESACWRLLIAHEGGMQCDKIVLPEGRTP